MCIGNGRVIVILTLVEEVGVGVICALVVTGSPSSLGVVITIVALEVGACAWLQCWRLI